MGAEVSLWEKAVPDEEALFLGAMTQNVERQEMKVLNTKIQRKQRFGKMDDKCKKGKMAKVGRILIGGKAQVSRHLSPYACLFVFLNRHVAKRISNVTSGSGVSLK